MKNRIQNFFIKLGLLIISVIIGAIFYKLVVRECIDVFIKINLTGKKGFIIFNFFKVTTVMFTYGTLLVLFKRKISLVFKIFLTSLYLGTMFILLFARPKMSRGFNFDPFTAFKYLNSANEKMYFIGNIVFFMPIGYFIRRDSFIRAFILAMSIELNIELVQYAFKRGYFDLSDIFINMIGIFTLYFICKGANYLVKK